MIHLLYVQPCAENKCALLEIDCSVFAHLGITCQFVLIILMIL